MNVLITGSNGFIAKNLLVRLENEKNIRLLLYNRSCSYEQLEEYCREADFIYHLAGVNRAENEQEFISGNYELTRNLITILKKYKNRCPILYSSSIQAEQDHVYGRSKGAAEKILLRYAKEENASVYIYRLENVFGKWCRPDYNSVVATFCYNIARELPVKINDADAKVQFVYIDDVIDAFIGTLKGETDTPFLYLSRKKVHSVRVGELAEKIYYLKACYRQSILPEIPDLFLKQLNSTFHSYLPQEDLLQKMTMHCDERGSFTEFLKTVQNGQFSVNVCKPGFIKGNHWHNTKLEKFLVVSGEGVIHMQNLKDERKVEYRVYGSRLEVIDIPPGYVHNIQNSGNEDLVFLIWANEIFDASHPDTYYREVL